MLGLAIDAVEREDADALCALGVEPTCRSSMSRMARAGTSWPVSTPVVVFEGRFGRRNEGGYAVTLCVEVSGGDQRITDFAVYDGVDQDASNVRDPVYWTGDRLESVLQSGSPEECDAL